MKPCACRYRNENLLYRFNFSSKLTTVESTEQDWPLLNSLLSYPLNVKRTAAVEDFSNGEVAARDAFSRSRIAAVLQLSFFRLISSSLCTIRLRFEQKSEIRRTR